MEKTKIIGYISTDYFRERSIREMKDNADPLMHLLWDFVVKLLESENEEVKMNYYYPAPYFKEEYRVRQASFNDPFAAERWDGDSVEEKAKNIINYIMAFCMAVDKDSLSFGGQIEKLKNNLLHTLEAKRTVFALIYCVLYPLRTIIDKDITGVDTIHERETDYIRNYVTDDNGHSDVIECFMYLFNERNIQDFVVKDTFLYRKRQKEQTEKKTQPKPEKPVRTFGLGEKVTVALLMKLESRLGTSGLNTNERAMIYSAITGFSKDKIYTLLSGNFDLTEAYHLSDVEKANEILEKLNIKRKIVIDRKSKKQ